MSKPNEFVLETWGDVKTFLISLASLLSEYPELFLVEKNRNWIDWMVSQIKLQLVQLEREK